MSLLAGAKKPGKEPFIGTIVGTPGSGKTSLAAAFPAPFMIRTTGEAIPSDLPEGMVPDMLGEVQKVADLWAQLMALVDEDHSYQTLIIDSVTGLDALFSADIIASDPKARGLGSALGGYGAGYDALAANHARVRRAAEAIRKRRGMNVVFLAHADITTIDPPDSDSYNQWSLRLHKKSLAPYVDSVSLVGFVRQATILMGDEGSKKAKTTGERVITAYMTPSSLAKNRLGITEDIEFIQGENPLEPYLTAQEPKKPVRKQSEPKPETTETTDNEEGTKA